MSTRLLPDAYEGPYLPGKEGLSSASLGMEVKQVGLVGNSLVAPLNFHKDCEFSPSLCNKRKTGLTVTLSLNWLWETWME